MAQNLIHIAHLYIKQNDHTAFEEVLDELHFFELSWWQINLLEAYKLYSQNNVKEARQLADLAKHNATEKWGKGQDQVYTMIVSEP